VDALPFIDEYRQAIAAPRDAAWSALVRVLRRPGRGASRFARLLGCDPAAGTAEFAGRPGETLPGFRVAAAEPGRRLELRGRHRFARYALTFELGDGEIRALTHAEFPGVAGRLYRAAVIGSGGHRWIARSMLRRIARAARVGSVAQPRGER
jgi:hypothetical protein